MAVTILHISDLHRDAGSHITTRALAESLRRDRDRYVNNERVGRPDIVVVSGDIVYGVSPHTADAVAQLSAQYNEAYEFLAELSDTFFDGNREKVVLVPGNHDVSRVHLERSLERVDIPPTPEQKDLLAEEFFAYGSRMRWGWRDFTMRRIVNIDEYHRRMEPFAQFFERFYSGRRAFPLEPAQQYSIHDFPELGIAILGLSSCHENDIYNRVGRIHPDCIAIATGALAPVLRQGRMLLAVWHHSLHGATHDVDYVDADFLQSLMDGGVVVGMHGHQHRAQLLEHRFTADQTRGMVVISAGTLCGGPKALPTGRMRAYNVIVLDAEREVGTVHVREMRNTDFSLPVWGAAYVSEFSGSSLEFRLTSARRSVSIVQLVEDADVALRKGDAAAAFAALRSHLDDAFARRVAAAALEHLRDWPNIKIHLNPPRSATEFILLADALYETGDKAGLASLIESSFAKQSTDQGVVQCIALMRARLGGH